MRNVRSIRSARTAQQGFTMIELIVVIVILGILAATALPKFVDMRGDAQQAAVTGVAGAAGSAMNVNFSGCAVMNNVVTLNKCVKVSTCATATVASLLQGGLPNGYSSAVKTGQTDLTASNTATTTCSVSYTSGAITYTADFPGIGAGN
ncbi:MAG: type II secretion system protein [Burkholderiaceae bacterium]